VSEDEDVLELSDPLEQQGFEVVRDIDLDELPDELASRD
jgi:hypothetical protein